MTHWLLVGFSSSNILVVLATLIVDSGYTDPKTIVVKFRKGLNTQIQNVVATMAVSRPSDEIPKQWYDMARTVDQN
jgi:hypothetical protein